LVKNQNEQEERMMKKIWTTAILTIVLCTVSLIPTLQAQSSQDTLTQYISNLQKNPNDYALREKIIKHVQGMRQKPAIPEEARKHFIKAVTMQKEAKHAKEFEYAASSYNQALLIAPWWPEAYYNLSIALEQSGQFDAAIKALRLYIVTNPTPANARAAQDKIYAIEAKKEMAAKGSSSEATEEKKKITTTTEIKRDGRFIAYNNGTVLDTWTNLMWAAHDNGSAISWEIAKSYCENYRGGGYTDWRMPTLNELTGLSDSSKSYRAQYNDVHLTELIKLTIGSCWSSDTRGSDALLFNFWRGTWYGFRNVSDNLGGAALPVRSGK
jgi:tetratricopeptide (TPR) repeat protein